MSVFDAPESQLTGIDGTGRPVWTRQLPAVEWIDSLNRCGEDHVCVWDGAQLTEVELDTGAPRWRWPYANRAPVRLSRNDDDSIAILGHGFGEAPAGGGEPRYSDASGTAIAHSPGGSVLMLEGNGSLRLYDSPDTSRPLAPGAGILPMLEPWQDFSDRPLPTVLGNDGTATMPAWPCTDGAPADCTDTLDVVRLSPGGLLWRVHTEVPGELIAHVRATQVIADGMGGVFVFVAVEDEAQSQAQVFVERIDADGDVLWRRRWSEGNALSSSAHFLPDHDALAVVWRGRGGTWEPLVEVLDADTGAVTATHVLACTGVRCGDWNVEIAADGRIVAAGAATDQAWLLGWDDLFDEPAGAALDVSGISGAWYAPRSNGQGFSIRRYPGLRTVFMPWFTFDDVQQNETHAQRWYALQGDYVDGATSMTLAIVERHDGRFATEPAGPNEFVGEAKLTLQSCDRALLDYRFDAGENDGKAGVIALQPILPRAQPCADGDGGTHPAQANYDSDMTGSWFDPATSGQGLEMDRIAPSGNDPGLLFAAWFTFAPEDVGSGDNDQRWLTLQGQAPGANGSVRTTIIQTVGGRFDAEPTNNMFAIGQAELVSQGCDRMTLRYRFDDSTDAGEFRARSGEIALQRIGACVAD